MKEINVFEKVGIAMKKIIYVSDYTLDQYNSVRDILYNLLNHKDMGEYEHVIVKSKARFSNPIGVIYTEGYKTYTIHKSESIAYLKEKNVKISEKVRYIFWRSISELAKLMHKEKNFYVNDSIRFIKSIIKKEKPDLVVFLTFTPNTRLSDVCTMCKVPYITIMYDTFINRPGENKAAANNIEKYVIQQSKGYFVPDFFYDGYLESFDEPKLKKYNLPLVIEEKCVIKAYNRTEKKYDYSYFGQMQYFRNINKIKHILRRIGVNLDVFSEKDTDSDDVFQIHEAITKDELYETVAGSRFLVAFDNSYPYDKYLPSKAYLYVSFTKPIIVFGDNKTSALKTFLKDYPYWYYQDINEDTDGLMEFIKSNKQNSFDKSVYSQFSEYLPHNAGRPLVEEIKSILEYGEVKL